MKTISLKTTKHEVGEAELTHLLQLSPDVILTEAKIAETHGKRYLILTFQEYQHAKHVSMKYLTSEANGEQHPS